MCSISKLNYNKNTTQADSYCNKKIYLFILCNTILIYVVLFYKVLNTPINRVLGFCVHLINSVNVFCLLLSVNWLDDRLLLIQLLYVTISKLWLPLPFYLPIRLCLHVCMCLSVWVHVRERPIRGLVTVFGWTVILCLLLLSQNLSI